MNEEAFQKYNLEDQEIIFPQSGSDRYIQYFLAFASPCSHSNYIYLDLD